jgi:3alpha(or 20beta)-hydroxysteroid dehydrogenase
MRLAGKVAIITGAARGQGEADARLFVEEGASVVIADVLDDEGAVLAKELGDAAVYQHLDVSDEQQWTDAVAATIERFGSVDVLVNNAAVMKMMALTQTSLGDYRRIIDVNQVGTFLGMRAVAAHMIGRRSGSIINIASVAGLQGNAGNVAYGASKFAVRGMTKCAAKELAPTGVRVNCVFPGVIDTPMIAEFERLGATREMLRGQIPLGHMATPLDIAKVVLFLASDDSAYCTGAEFSVDGGITA